MIQEGAYIPFGETDEFAASRKKELLQYISEGANVKDLEAAGYTPEEIDGILSEPEPITTSKEFDRDRQGGSTESAKLEEYTPTMRDSLRSGTEQLATNLGADKYTAQSLSGKVAGTSNQMGLLDLTPVGIAIGAQEGAQQFKRGYNSGSEADMALGALGVAGSAISLLPAGGIISKGVSKGAAKLVSKPKFTFNEKLYGNPDFGISATKPKKNIWEEALTAEPSGITWDLPAITLDYVPEKVSPEKALIKMKNENKEDLKNYPESSILFSSSKEKEKVFSQLKDKELIKLAEDLPHYNDKNYSNYHEDVLKTVAKYNGVSFYNLQEVIHDLKAYLPKKEDPILANLTESKLPYGAPVGERASKNSPARVADSKAEALGFTDTVYHTSISPDEFTSFNLNKRFDGQTKQAQDLLGVHVGTPRAAAERNNQAVQQDSRPTGYTMELRARATDPVTKENLAKMFGYDPLDVFSVGQGSLTESDIGEALHLYSDILFAGKERPKNSMKVAAVNLRRELAREGFTHIPYVNNVEDAGSISYIMLVDRPTDSPAVLRDVRAEFDPQKITDPDLRFAQGGVVEDNQMNRLFKEGGIADDGMSREPVTGNEIPPGSLASEVRDDIDVKLSEGEYVVPADVLRYYGVRFFEDLRAQAKRGMMEMENDGRIGGASVDEQGVPLESQDEQLTPEEEQMLQEALGTSGMAFGGMVEQPVSTPYQDQAMLYKTPTAMAEGGDVGFDRTQFTSGDGTAGGIEARKYINPLTKEVRTFNFIGNVALGAIPEGFVPWTQELEDQTQEAPVDNLEETGKKDSRTFRPEEGAAEDSAQGNWGKNNYDALMADPYAFGSTALEDSVKGVAGMLPGIRDITKVNAIAEAKAALAQLDPNSEEAKSLSDKIEFATNSISSPVIKGMVKTGLAGTSNAYQAQLDAESEARITVGAIDAATVAKTYTSPSDETPSQASPAGSNLDNSTSVTNTVDRGRPSGVTKLASGNTSVANTSAQIAPTASPTPVTSTTTNVTSNTANNTNKPLSGTGSISGTSNQLTTPTTNYTYGPQAKGGLIAKPKKAPKKTRGLAGK